MAIVGGKLSAPVRKSSNPSTCDSSWLGAVQQTETYRFQSHQPSNQQWLIAERWGAASSQKLPAPWLLLPLWIPFALLAKDLMSGGVMAFGHCANNYSGQIWMSGAGRWVPMSPMDLPGPHPGWSWSWVGKITDFMLAPAPDWWAPCRYTSRKRANGKYVSSLLI